MKEEINKEKDELEKKKKEIQDKENELKAKEQQMKNELMNSTNIPHRVKENWLLKMGKYMKAILKRV